MAIISISGKAGSGKDTVGKIIQWLLSSWHQKHNWTYDYFLENSAQQRMSEWKIKKWATALRKVSAILLGMDEQFLYTDEFKQMILPECWNKVYQTFENDENGNDGFDTRSMTGREFLQKLGTDAIRDGLHENTWVNALMSQYKTSLEANRLFHRNELLTEEGDDLKFEEKYPNWIITDTRFPNELAAVKKRGAITIRVNRNVNLSFDSSHPSETALNNAEFDYVIDNNGTIEELVEKIKPIILKINGNGSNSTG